MGLAPEDNRRVVVENIRPQVDGGRFSIKRIVGETVLLRPMYLRTGTRRSPSACNIDILRTAISGANSRCSRWETTFGGPRSHWRNWDNIPIA